MSTATNQRLIDDDVFAVICTIAVLLVVHALSLRIINVNDMVAATGADQTRGSNSVPVMFFAVFVAESLAIVGLYLLYQRLSEFWQRIVQYTIVAGVYLLAFQLLYWAGGWGGVVLGGTVIAVLRLAQRTGVYWLIHNLAAVFLAVLGAVLVGTIFGVWPLIGLLVLLLVWDHVAVNETGIMAAIVKFAAASGLPAYLVYNRTLRLDLEDVEGALNGDEDMPDGVAAVIGTGDFVFPAALAVSVATAVLETGGTIFSPLVVAPIIGVIGGAGILWMHNRDGAVPALPVLNGSAIAGFLVALALNGGIA